MISFYFDGIPIYVDEYIGDDRVLRGKNKDGTTYIIVSPKTVKMLQEGIKMRTRKDKLERILKKN